MLLGLVLDVLAEIKAHPARLVGRFLMEVGRRLANEPPEPLPSEDPEPEAVLETGFQSEASLTPAGQAMLAKPKTRAGALARRAEYLRKVGVSDR